MATAIVLVNGVKATVEEIISQVLSNNKNVVVEVRADDETATIEVVPLSVYEKDGGEYSDVGNGGEEVDKESFDVAFRVLSGESDLAEHLFTYYWCDTVSNGFCLRYAD